MQKPSFSLDYIRKTVEISVESFPESSNSSEINSVILKIGENSEKRPKFKYQEQNHNKKHV
jgi:hypothetical protein